MRGRGGIKTDRESVTTANLEYKGKLTLFLSSPLVADVTFGLINNHNHG